MVNIYSCGGNDLYPLNSAMLRYLQLFVWRQFLYSSSYWIAGEKIMTLMSK